jgi:glycosyltransferase involved in cell wall biosynthesis
MDEADILIVPLTQDIYNKCKSPIKFLEASSAGIPGVYQEIRQYQEVIDNGVNGFLAGSSQTWYKSIKALINDPKLRQAVGQAAFKSVENEWQIQDHVEDYAEFFKSILLT